MQCRLIKTQKIETLFEQHNENEKVNFRSCIVSIVELKLLVFYINLCQKANEA